MRRHIPAFAATALIATAFAGSITLVSHPASARAPRPSDAPESRESIVTSSFSVAETVPPAAHAPGVVRVARTQKRPSALAKPVPEDDSYPVPPASLLAQGVTRVRGAGRRVAITIDDGPSPNTDAILRTLSRYGVHATFFMIGRRVEAAPELARAVLAQGSEIGNHTYDHVQLRRGSILRDALEIRDGEQAIFEATGIRPLYVRPKGGEIDGAGIAAVKRLGKVYAYWDVESDDTVHEFSASRIRWEVMSSVRPGSVILLHETNPRTAEALPSIIRALKRRGYEVGDLSSLLRQRR